MPWGDGSHYDPLVGASSVASLVNDEIKVLPLGKNATLEASALEIARQHNVEAARKAAKKCVKKIKCGGCGALLDNSQAFQEHRMDGNIV